MKLPRHPTSDDRDPAREAISHHDEANFTETPTARKAIRQFQILVGFFTILLVGILALWIVPFLTLDSPVESPQRVEDAIDG